VDPGARRAADRLDLGYDHVVPIEGRGETTIARPIAEVFDYICDARNEPTWLPGARSVEKTSDGPVGLGTTFVGQYARAGRVELELVEFERPTRLTFRARSRIVDFDDAVELTAHESSTHLDARMTAEPRGAMRLVAPMMARTMRRQFSDNWAHLRTALEG
jgi:carbon monoxide dehydrogenase subunit G